MGKVNDVTRVEYGFALIGVLAIIVIAGVVGHIETRYKISGTVVEQSGEVVTIEDLAGHLWEYETDSLEVGDNVSMEFHNNTTDSTRKDDKIISIRVDK